HIPAAAEVPVERWSSRGRAAWSGTTASLCRCGAAAQRCFAGHVDLPGNGDHVLRRDVLRLLDLPPRLLQRICGGQQNAEPSDRNHKYCGFNLQQLNRSPFGARRTIGQTKADRRSACSDRKSTRLNSSHVAISYAV